MNTRLEHYKLHLICTSLFILLLVTQVAYCINDHSNSVAAARIQSLEQDLTTANDKVKSLEQCLVDSDEKTKRLEQDLATTNEKTKRLEQDLAAANEQLIYIENFNYIRCDSPIYDLPISEELQQFTYAVCSARGIADYYELVLAMMWLESNFRTDIISSTNDYGLMQINTCNHESLSNALHVTDFLEPHQNIYAGVYVIASLIRTYDGDTTKALMAYNMGQSGAAALWANGIYETAYSRTITYRSAHLDDYYSQK